MSNSSVYWYPWGEETFRRAKEENKSIFLFIESTSSNLSALMQKESFQDKSVIEILNEHFISIKINREERPEIEKFYQKVYKLMNRERGSSPLSIFMTDKLKPFFADGYISPQAHEEKLGFKELLNVIHTKYATDYQMLTEKGDEVLHYIEPKEKTIEATRLNINITKTIQLHTENLLDKENGGFGTLPKFPNCSTLQLLLETYQLEKDEKLLNSIKLTLDKMAFGGLYDHESGGFFQYTTDEKWLSPNLVKTTYNNAQLAQLYLRAFHLTQDVAYKKVALSTIEFMLKNMSEKSLFYTILNLSENASTDKRVITSWNSMMITALFQASTLEDKGSDRYRTIAIESLEALLNTLYIEKRLYHSTIEKSKPKTEAFLEDYAYLGEALIEAYQVTLDEDYLLIATELSNRTIEEFYQYGEWNFSTKEILVKEEIHDTLYPSSISTLLSLFLSISPLVKSDYKHFVFKTLELNSYNLMRQPLSSPKLTHVLLRYLKEDIS